MSTTTKTNSRIGKVHTLRCFIKGGQIAYFLMPATIQEVKKAENSLIRSMIKQINEGDKPDKIIIV